MTEELGPYDSNLEQAKILKALGYNRICQGVWYSMINEVEFKRYQWVTNQHLSDGYYASPSLENVWNWLKIEKDLDPSIKADGYGYHTLELKHRSLGVIFYQTKTKENIDDKYFLQRIIINVALQYLTIDKQFLKIK